MSDDVSDILPDSALEAPSAPARSGSSVDDIIPPHITDTSVVKAAVKNPSLWDKYIGFQEGQLAGATGGIASLVGGLGYLGALGAGQGTDNAKRIQEEIQSGLTYSPRTEEGKSQAADMQEAASYLGEKGGNIAGSKVADVTGSPMLGAAVNALYNVPQFLIGAKSGKEALGDPVEPKAPVPTEQETALKNGQALGYVVPPATTNPTVLTRGLEGVAGKISTAQAASIKNQRVTNSLVRQELGLPEDAELSHDTLAQYRAQQSPAYQAVAAIPEIKFGDSYNKELGKITTTSDKITSDLPDYRSTGAEKVQALVNSIKPPNGTMSGETAVELSKSLRSEAKAYDNSANRTGDPHDRALASAYRDSATAVENAVQSHLESIGKPELAEGWDQARRNIAKSYSVENSLDGAGNVDAGKLGKQLIKGKPLSGNLEAAANFANSFPKANKVNWSKESVPGVSPLDIGTALGGALGLGALSHEVVPSIMGGIAIPAARMAARATAVGKIGQGLAVPSPPTTPGSIATPLGRLLFASPRNSVSNRNTDQNSQ